MKQNLIKSIMKKDRDATFLLMVFGAVISIKAIAVWYMVGN